MNTQPKTARRTRTATLGLTAVACIFATAALTGAQQDVEVEIEGALTAIDEWQEVRLLISEERARWQLGKELTIDRIEMVRQEIETLRGRIGDTEKGIAEADEKLGGLVEQNERLKTAATTLRDVIGGLEGRVRSLLRRLPTPITERVASLSQLIPEDPEETEASLGERYRNVVGILNEVDRFNAELTVSNEVRTLPDGSTALVPTLYVGLGQAYYVTASRDAAGIGRPSEEGWVWHSADDAAEVIARAIAVQSGELAAEFVPLPVTID